MAVAARHAAGMIRSGIAEAQLTERFDARRVLLGFCILTPALIALALVLPTEIALAFALAFLVPWFVKNPIRSVYVLVGAACLIEVFPLGYPDSITDNVFFFLNLNRNGVSLPAIQPAEVIMVVGGLLTWARAAQDAGIRRPTGPIMVAFSLYVGTLLLGAMHGLLSGGTFNLVLWEIRPQIQAFVLFLLTASLVGNRRQIQVLAIVMLLSEIVKGAVGAFRYYFTLHGNLGSAEEVLAHEDSYFLGLYLLAAAIAVMWLPRRRLLIPLLLGAPLVTMGLLANSRRAGLFALGVALAVMLVLGIRFEPRLRTRLLVTAIIAGVVLVVVVASGWNSSGSGMASQIARSVRSIFDPSLRDNSSDIYRLAENANLAFNFRSSPIIGIGFGFPFAVVYPMADISQIYALWNVIPHNNVLWIGMRMGTLGFVTFFCLLGMAMVQGCQILRTRRDPLLRAVVVFCLAALAAELVVAYTDLQLENNRNMIMMGVVLGLLARIPFLPEGGGEASQPERERTDLARATPRRPRPRLLV